MASANIDRLDADILRAVVDPDTPSLSVPVARAVLALQFNAKQKTEIHDLLDKNNAGVISARQRARLEAYERIGALLNLLQAKARSTLSGKAPKRR